MKKFFESKAGKVTASIALLLLIVTIVFWDEIKLCYLSMKTEKETKNGTFDETELNKELNLKEGVKGQEVARLQSLLNKDSSAGLKVDGIFGPLTKSALYKHKSVYEITLNAYSTVFGNTGIAGGLPTTLGVAQVNNKYVQTAN